MRKIFLVFLTLFLFFLAKNYIYAAEFSTSYDVVYRVSELGITTVNQNISLTNLKSDLYAKEYRVLIGSEKIENVQGFDSLGKLNLEVSKGEGGTEIKASFNEKVVGLGKTLRFNLSYSTPEVARKEGKIWKINIPKFTGDETLFSYKISLIVPPSFGEPAYIKPPPAYGLTWTEKELSSSITVAFGEYQSFDFNFIYNLKNNSLSPRQYIIPLPPDTLYQKIFLKTLTPNPQNVFVDEDGNWLASYKLFPQQEVKVLATGSALIFLKKRPDFPNINFTKEKYLTAQRFWEKDDKEITELAKKLKTPKEIYDYVIQNLSYDVKRVGKDEKRLGAKEILKDPKRATCREFTDLFIALCRAAGIPAREVNGFGFTPNPILRSSDILHAWPEYFDFKKNIWVEVDPTWEKTTGGVDYFDNFDFDHLTILIHGLSSETPVAPAAYKGKEKNINITPSQNLPQFLNIKPQFLINFPKKVIGGKSIQGEVKVKNIAPQALYDFSFKVSSSKFFPPSQEFKIPVLPPFGQKTFLLNFSNPQDKLTLFNLLTGERNKFIFTFNGDLKDFEVKIEPLLIFFLPFFLSLFLSLGIFFLTVFFFKKIWRYP